jgi:hypothetical protein
MYIERKEYVVSRKSIAKSSFFTMYKYFITKARMSLYMTVMIIAATFSL